MNNEKTIEQHRVIVDSLEQKTDSLSYSVDSTQIYENGKLFTIGIDDLVNNKIALRQFMNNHNLLSSENEELKCNLNDISSELKTYKTTTYINIFSTIFNVIGTIILGIASNSLSQASNNSISIFFIILSGIIILFSNLANILYPYTLMWSNKNKTKGETISANY